MLSHLWTIFRQHIRAKDQHQIKKNWLTVLKGVHASHEVNYSLLGEKSVEFGLSILKKLTNKKPKVLTVHEILTQKCRKVVLLVLLVFVILTLILRG